MEESKENNGSKNVLSSKQEKELFGYDEARIDKERSQAAWRNDVKYFKKVRVSALAAIKMLKHSLAGVDKGRKRGSNPVEVMGLCIGKSMGDTVVVMDTCPLPVEGFETRVVADDAQVYMTQLLDSMELRRKEAFVGWYHSHPFDVESWSMCYCSFTDVQTQYQWQSNIPNWVAIVVDPLRSIARQEPEFGCFRCYPANHTPPVNECPDGSIVTDKHAREVRWGLAYNRYYALEMSYFMSTLGKNVLNIMSRKSLWAKVLSSSSITEPENRTRFGERVTKATAKLDAAASSFGRSGGRMSSSFQSDENGDRKPAGVTELEQSSQAFNDMALEHIKGHISQISKHALFNTTHDTASAVKQERNKQQQQQHKKQED